MNELHTTIKVWLVTRKKLRLIAALTGQSIVAVVDRLATAELSQLQQKETQTNQQGESNAD